MTIGGSFNKQLRRGANKQPTLDSESDSDDSGSISRILLDKKPIGRPLSPKPNVEGLAASKTIPEGGNVLFIIIEGPCLPWKYIPKNIYSSNIHVPYYKLKTSNLVINWLISNTQKYKEFLKI